MLKPKLVRGRLCQANWTCLKSKGFYRSTKVAIHGLKIEKVAGKLKPGGNGKLYVISFLYVCMVNTIYLFRFVETPRKFIIANKYVNKYVNLLLPFQ